MKLYHHQKSDSPTALTALLHIGDLSSTVSYKMMDRAVGESVQDTVIVPAALALVTCPIVWNCHNSM